ncbi:MAG: M81 family metallopeptidase [Bryobacteraceae bacterium]|nr:M81 family metallopeptidase [Bryobacteraceae bacterium]MDW8376983.1 M81 family metallopeptidase [Bryobacterales bacterium]
MGARERVGVVGFLHESNTFSPVQTRWEDFATTSMTEGEAMRERWSGKPHELGGMLDGCQVLGMDARPGFASFAVPSGPICAADFERLAAALLASVRGLGQLDGLLVALHGATVSEAFPDADGELLRRIRDTTGPQLPIVVTVDLHANISAQMLQQATAITAYRTNPHLDQRERGFEAAQLMARILREGVRPVMWMESPPWVIPIAAQHTLQNPARSLYEDLQAVLSWPKVLSASVCLGFYYADVAEMGTSFLTVADGDLQAAKHAAQWMARRAWARRMEFLTSLPSPAEAVAQAKASSRKPVVLMDVGDNVGGGSAANSTLLLEECLRQGARNALIILYAPEAVRRCLEAGVRQRTQIPLNGLLLEGRVRTLSDGLFTETQVRHGGWTYNDQGVTAVLETDSQHTVVFTSRRMAPMSLEQILSLGVRPEHKDILIVKGVVAPRAAYEPVAGEIILVDTPGETCNNPASFSYRHRRVPMFPMEPEAEYAP